MSKVYFLKCKVELGKHAFKLLIRAISFSSPLLYKQRSTPHSTHLLCRVRVKEERQHRCPKATKVLCYSAGIFQQRKGQQDSATVVYFSKEKGSWYISAKKRTARLCYSAGIFQQRKGQQVSATVLVYISIRRQHIRTASICYSAGIYQYKKAAYQDSKYLVTMLLHDSKKGQLDSRKRTTSIL
jgi:hypothetical protein